MRCSKCMAENAATRRFCAECGAPLPLPCPACGFEKNEPNARFCSGCGKPLGKALFRLRQHLARRCRTPPACCTDQKPMIISNTTKMIHAARSVTTPQ